MKNLQSFLNNQDKQVNSNRGVTCFCCGADLTAPQFHNGKPYGYSCILKVNPNYKRSKDSGFWLKADKIEYKKNVEHPTHFYVIAYINGVRFVDRTYHNTTIYDQTGEIVPDMDRGTLKILGGLIKMSKYKNGTNNYWNHITIEQEEDENRKFFVSSISSLRTRKKLFQQKTTK